MGLESIVSSLLAYEKGRAQPCAATVRDVINPSALVICPIAMSGEGTSIHIIALGKIGQNPKIISVPDPRNRDNQYLLFRRLSLYIDKYFDECTKSCTFPQFWVSTPAVANHLDTIAERLRFSTYDPLVRRLGELLFYCTDIRLRVEGQQSLHAAATVLNRHYAVPQDAVENQHLLTVLTSIKPPAGRNLLVALAEAE